MGWTYSFFWNNRDTLLDHLVSKRRWGETFDIVKSCPRGNEHWYIAKRLTDGHLFIGLDIMAGGTRDNPGWGYKDISESMGPSSLSCPVSFFKLVPDPGSYATSWRQKVRDYHREQKQHKAKYVPGMLFLHGSRLFKLASKSDLKKGRWNADEVIVKNNELLTCQRYWVSSRQLKRATFFESENAVLKGQRQINQAVP
jgi:hypothetical protein